MIRLLLLVILSIFLSACDNDSFKDANLDEKIAREAMCVVASERFLLYKEADKHKRHGLQAGADRFERRGDESDFLQKVYFTRLRMIRLPKEYLAEILISQCDTKLTNNQFNNA